ncbi:hypothetical protein [Janthinobacterium sp. NKUCC06_STL]|uniref:hypothetical protein n=1 Tax=Janthinobacterium sp. NKUCC06_STL TaxID=2842127 RepID=UPI001C5B6114|nr:hypothetical protein [Janthinobacterium sp. NKUCC06_STL]MBW3512021.1 hypothetical protein [Janthinobacterium sp. NKUCC06_STL]
MMNPSNGNVSVIRQDHGEMNQKLLERQAPASLSPVESAGRIVKMSLSSPEGKRLFLRYFDITQLHMHYISKIARLSLPDADIELVEKQVFDLVQEKINIVDKEMVRVEQELRKHNIDSLATYTIVPLTLEARVLGKIGRRLLELTGKIDQLMPMLETMAIDELISESQLNIKKTFFKKSVRAVASVVRTLKSSLQKKSAAIVNSETTATGKKNPGDQTDHSSSSDFASENKVADVDIVETVQSTDIKIMTNKSGNEIDTVSSDISKLVGATEPIELPAPEHI